jgi:hypothetical protein
MNLRELARGKTCQVRIPLHCNHDPATTVLAHYRLSGYVGAGQKPDDWSFGSWACSACHDVVDGRAKTDHDRNAVRLMHAEGCMRTQAELRKMKAAGEI